MLKCQLQLPSSILRTLHTSTLQHVLLLRKTSKQYSKNICSSAIDLVSPYKTLFKSSRLRFVQNLALSKYGIELSAYSFVSKFVMILF